MIRFRSIVSFVDFGLQFAPNLANGEEAEAPSRSLLIHWLARAHTHTNTLEHELYTMFTFNYCLVRFTCIRCFSVLLSLFLPNITNCI